jgi:hypothetical protein
MAFSYSKLQEQVIGGLRLQVYSVNFASVTAGHIKSGLSNVIHAHLNNAVSDDQGIVKPNKASGGGADEKGGIDISSVTSNDTGTMLVIGV